jgi:hypothetical protein
MCDRGTVRQARHLAAPHLIDDLAAKLFADAKTCVGLSILFENVHEV